MSAQVWQVHLDKQQLKNIPLIGVCAIVVQFMALGRDAILGDFGWTEPVTISTFISLTVVTALTILARLTAVPAHYAQLFGASIIMALALRPFATMPFRDTVFPMVDALVVFSLGVCLLSLRYFLFTLAAFLAPWITLAFASRSAPQAAGMLGLVLVASIIAYLVLRSRIEMHAHLIQLRSRISDLESLLHMCAHCKNMRLENGQWIRIERYLIDTTKKNISHGICLDCLKKYYGELYENGDFPTGEGQI